MNVMAGKALLEEQDDSIRSACQFPIFKAAKAILALPDKEARRLALDRHPDAIRPHIEAEVRKLWKTL